MCVCAGYPRLLSGDLSDLTKVPEKQRVQFPEAAAEESWSRDPRWVKKYFLKFPFYPFRTLCPRDLGAITKTLNFDNASPIFPANTQLDLVFQKRKKTNFLKYMLPFNLNPNLGTSQSTCTAEEYTNALTFTQPATAGAVAVTYIIERVDINVTNMYLQVGYTHTHFYHKMMGQVGQLIGWTVLSFIVFHDHMTKGKVMQILRCVQLLKLQIHVQIWLHRVQQN